MAMLRIRRLRAVAAAPVLLTEPICAAVCIGSSGGATARLAGTTSEPMVGTEKLMFGVWGSTTATGGASGFCSSAVLVVPTVGCGGKTCGSTIDGNDFANGGAGLMEISPRRAPVMPMSRKRMQTELTHASLQVRVAVRRRQAKPRQFVFQLVPGIVRFASMLFIDFRTRN